MSTHLLVTSGLTLRACSARFAQLSAMKNEEFAFKTRDFARFSQLLDAIRRSRHSASAAWSAGVTPY